MYVYILYALIEIDMFSMYTQHEHINIVIH